MHVLSSVANRNWGADRKSLSNLYLSSIQSKINYGDFIYGSACTTLLECLDRVQYKAIRIISGNLYGTSNFTLEPEVNILPLKYKRDLNGLQYFGRICRVQQHPTRVSYEDFFHFDYYKTVRKNFPLPVVGRYKNLAEKLKLPVNKIEKIELKAVHDCVSANVKFPFTLKGADKSNPEKCKQEFLEMKNNKYKDYFEIYTDGSKIKNRTGSAYVVNGIPCKVRLTRYSSVYSAEMYAILKSLQFIKKNRNSLFVIFSDSLSALETIKNNKNKTAISIKITQTLNSIRNKIIVFEWIPSHVEGIIGNELADKAAKAATRERFLYRMPLNIDEYKSLVKKKIYKTWQESWDRDWRARPCHLYKIKPILGDWKSSYREVRKEEVVMSRLRTGNVRYLVQHLFPKANLPNMEMCNSCGVKNSVEHLILTCPNWRIQRIPIVAYLRRLKLPNTLGSVLGDNFNHQILVNYLKNISYYKMI